MRYKFSLLLVLCGMTGACASRGGADGRAVEYNPPDMAMASQLGDGCRGVPIAGRCRDNKTVQACQVNQDGRSYVSTVSCGNNEVCINDGNSSYCKLTASCRDGLSRCFGSGTQVCQGGSWVTSNCITGTACQRFPGAGVRCVPAGSTFLVRGQLQYQFRTARSDYSGLDPTYYSTDARNVFVVVADGSEALGTGFTGSDGSFSVPVYRAPGVNGVVLFIPILFWEDDTAALAVLQPTGGGDTDYHHAAALWSFSVANLPAPFAGQINVGNRIVQGESAGALFIFDWAQFAFQRAQSLFGSWPQASLGWLWSPGIDMNCGACFRNRSFAGTDVGTSSIHFDTTIELSGTANNPSHWSISVINHEFGHYIMDQYSKSPHEGGAHSVSQLSTPGLAWSEGWATLSGQTAISNAAGTPRPIYFDVNNGTSFWVDISQRLVSGKGLPGPNPYGPLDQKLNEFVVSGMVWGLWSEAGDRPIFSGLSSRRITGGLNRGYPTVDLLDYADALACGGLVSAFTLDTKLRVNDGFPWDGRPVCP